MHPTMLFDDFYNLSMKGSLVEALGDAGMPRFAFNPATGKWVTEYEGKTATHKKLAQAIAENNLQMEYYTKTCCITGRCATCEGKCGALARDFNVKNATNRDSESVAYWQKQMRYAIKPEFGDMTVDTPESLDNQASGAVKYSHRGYEKRFFPGNVFPSGQTHTAVTEWANRKDVKTGDRRLVFYRGAYYQVGKFDDMDFGYLVTKKYNEHDYKEELKEYGEIDSEESVQARIDRVDALYRETDEYGHGRYHAGSSGIEYGGEDLPLLSMDQDSTEGRGDSSQTERDRQGSLRDQRGVG